MAAQAAFTDSYAEAHARRDHRQCALASAGMIILIDACYCDFRPLRVWCERLDESAAQVAAPQDPDWQLMVGAARTLAAGHGAQNVGPPVPETDQILRLLRQAREPDCALYAASAMIVFLDAMRRDSEATSVEVEANHFESHAGPWSRGHWLSIRGQHALFYHRLDEAAELLAKAASLGRSGAMRPLGQMTSIMQARLAIAHGRNEDVQRLLARCEPIDDKSEPMWRAVVAQLQALALLGIGRYDDALHSSHRAIAFAQAAAAPADEAAQMRVLEGYCLLAVGDGAAAAGKFRQAADQTSGQQAHVVNLLAQLADADVALMRDDVKIGRARLAAAMADMRALHYGAFLWPLPAVASRLCGHALALDIEPEYVRSIVRQRKLSPPPRAPAAWPWAMTIRALGRYEISPGGELLRPVGKAQAKPLELLRCIVALGGSDVAVDRITQMLWRGEGREGAKSAFAVTLHRLRHLVGGTQLITVVNGRVTLDPQRVWIDHRALFGVLDAIDAATQRDTVATEVDALLALYAGPLLADDHAPWAKVARQQLRLRVDATIARCASALAPSRLRITLSRALAADPELPLTAALLAAPSERFGRPASGEKEKGGI